MQFSAIPYCGPAAVPAGFWAAWNLDPWLLAALGGLIAVHIAAYGHRCRTSGGHNHSTFAAAWLVLVVAFVSPLCALSVALFSARVVHHLLLVGLAAPLLVIAWRGLFARLVSGRRLVPMAALHVALFWFWHAPAPYAAALASVGTYWAMELSLFLSALLFWTAALDRRASTAAFAPAVIGVMAQMGVIGALLVFAAQPLYAAHEATTWPWGLTPLADQQLAGLIMWVPGAVPYLVLLLVRVGRLLARQEAELARQPDVPLGAAAPVVRAGGRMARGAGRR
jgi:putative membrane protein